MIPSLVLTAGSRHANSSEYRHRGEQRPVQGVVVSTVVRQNVEYRCHPWFLSADSRQLFAIRLLHDAPAAQARMKFANPIAGRFDPADDRPFRQLCEDGLSVVGGNDD